jgi:hypothetical protein
VADLLLPPPLEEKLAPGQAAPGADTMTLPPPVDTRLEDSLDAASKVNPDHAGQVVSLSRQTGLDPEYVAGNVEAVKAAASKPSTAAMGAMKAQRPATAKFVENPVNMAVTHDDLDNLAAHEGTVTQAQNWLQAAKAGLEASSAGLAVRRKLPDVQVRPGAPMSQRVAEQAGALLGDSPLMLLGMLGGGAAGGAAAGAAGTAVAGPFGLLAAPAGAEVGAGAGAFALPAAVKEGLREKISGESLQPGKILKAAGLQGAVGAVSAEAGALAAPLGLAAKEVASLFAMGTAGAAVEGRRPTMTDYTDAAVLMAGLHGLGKLGDLATASKLRARAPEVYQEHVQTLTAGLPISEPKVPLAAFEKYWQSANIDPAQAAEDLGAGDSYREAQTTGGHVSIPTGAFLSKEMDAHRTALMPDVTFQQPDGSIPATLNQRNEQVAKIGEQLKAQAAESDAAVKADAEMRAGHDAVYNDAREKLDLVPKPDAFKTDAEWEKAKDQYAKITAQRSVVTAQRRGDVTPEEVYRGTIKDIVADGTDDEKAAAARAEELDRLAASGGLTPVKDFIRKNGGIDVEAARKYGWASELPDMERSGIFRRGGMTPDTAAEMLHEAGLLPEYDANVMADHLRDEGFRENEVKQRAGGEKLSAAARRKTGRLSQEPGPENPDEPQPQGERPAEPAEGSQSQEPTQPQASSPSQEFPFAASVTGNAKNFKALFGEAPLDGTAEMLRNELRNHVAAGKSEDEAIAARMEALEGTTRPFVDSLDMVLKAPEAARRMVFGNLTREIERRHMLTGEPPAPEVLNSWQKIAKSLGEDGKLFQSQAPAPAFYSKLERDVERTLPEKFTADQLRAVLRGSKAEEREWSGIDKFLDGKEKLTKGEVLEYLRANRLEVHEVTLGNGADDTKFSKYTLPAGENYREMLLTLPSEEQFDPAKVEIVRNRRSVTQGEVTLKYDGRVMGTYGDEGTVETGWMRPESELRDIARRLWETGDERNGVKAQSGAFRSGHFDQANVLAHVRFNDRTDADGKRALFLEEVQSDWHQKGRREGYRLENDAKREPLQKQYDEILAQQRALSDRKVAGHMSNPDVLKWNELEDHRATIQREIQALNRIGVPDAPFKKSWHEFALKRMLRYAAENGYDKIAWTTGEQQADRYDLGKKIESVHYQKVGDGQFDVWATDKHGEHVEIGRKSAAELPDVFGKELAEKIVAGQGAEVTKLAPADFHVSESEHQYHLATFDGLELEVGKGTVGSAEAARAYAAKYFNDQIDYTDLGSKKLSGVDLKVGGEGMSGFYDKMIPSFLNKFGKRYGAQVGETEIPLSQPGDKATDLEMENGDPGGDWEARQGKTAKVHAMDITPALREAAVNEGFPLFQDQGDAAKPKRGYFDPNQKVIGLMKSADASTFLHESAHAWLTDEWAYIKSGRASEEYLKDWKTLSGWLGVTEDQKDLTREQHEQFAKGFEAYLRDAQAPAKGLRRPFAAFRRWLTNIYRDVQSQLGVQITPEVRGVMDRMLATEQEIKEAERSLYRVGEDQMAGMDPHEAAWLRAAQEEAHEDAVSSLLKEQMGETTAKRIQFLKDERERVTAQMTAEQKQEPAYAAADAMKVWFGERRSAAEVAGEYLGEKLDDAARRKFDDIAEDHGFATGDEMAKSLVSAPKLEDRVKDLTDAYMSQYADIKDTDRLRASAEEAVHSGKQLELMHMEGAALADAGRKVKVTDAMRTQRREEAKIAAAAARQQAREMLSIKPVNEATAYRPYLTAERNAAVKAAEAMKDGDFEGAKKFKERQMLNHALAMEAMKNRRDSERAVKFLEKYAGRKQDFKDMPYGFIRQIDGLLERGGLREGAPMDEATQAKIAQNMEAAGKGPVDIANATGMAKAPNGAYAPESMQQFTERVRDDYHILPLPPKVESLAFGEYGKNMTMADLRDLKMAVQVINEVGRGEDRFLSFDAKMGIRDAAEDLRGRIEDVVGSPYAEKLQPGFKHGSDMRGMLGEAIDAVLSLPDKMVPSMVNIRTLAKFLDGGAEGPAHDYILTPLERAGNWKLERRARMMEDVRKVFEDHYKPEELAQYKSERAYTFYGRKWTKENIVAMALNWGNQGNRDRVMRGFGLDRVQVQEMLNTLSEKDVKFVQAVWDHLETYWPEIKAQEMAVNGVEPGKVQALPFETRYGTLRGGYYPLAYDFEKSGDAFRTEEQKNALYKQYSAVAAHTDHGFTQGRVDTLKRPVRLNFDVMFNHLENVVHDLAYRKSIIDVQRFLRQTDAKEAITGALDVRGLDTFGKTLKAVASDQGEFLDGAEKAYRWFRHAGTFAVLGYRATTFPLRLAGDFSNASWEMGPFNLAGAMKDFYLDPAATKDWVDGKSTMMKFSAETRERDLYDISKSVSGEGGAWRKHAFIVDTLADRIVKYPMWSEVYKANLGEKGEQEAVRLADDAVIRSFGSGTVLDQVGAQRGSELKKLTSMYYSWTSMMFNRAWSDGKIAGLEYKEGNRGAAAATVAKAVFYSWLFPAIYENVVRETFRNSQNPNGDDRWKRVAARTLEQPFSYMVIARDIAAAGVGKALGERGADFKMSPMEDALDTVLETVGKTLNAASRENKHFDEKWSEQAARSAAIVFKYPQQVNSWVFNFLDWMQDKGDATWRDAVTRRTKK